VQRGDQGAPAVPGAYQSFASVTSFQSDLVREIACVSPVLPVPLASSMHTQPLKCASFSLLKMSRIGGTPVPMTTGTRAPLRAASAGVDGHHLADHLFEHLERIVAEDQGVGGIEIQANARVFNLSADFQEYFRGMAEIRETP
jgi:hypothetical protein